MSGLYKFFPIPSDKMGTFWALSTIKDACIVEYGPGGTTHYSIEGIYKINGQITATTYTTHVDEDDIVMGSVEKLRNTIKEIDEIHHPPYMFIVASSLISVIGSDIAGLVYEIQDEVKAKLIIYQGGGFQGDYTCGIRQVLSDLATHVVKPCRATHPKSYNLIGCCVDDYRYFDNIKAIQATLDAALGLRCGCVFTADSSLAHIEAAPEAAVNIVLRHEGLACAEILEGRFGTPYFPAHPIGYQATFDMIAKAAEILGLTADEAYLSAMEARMRRNLTQVKRHFRDAGSKKAIIGGGYDGALSYEAFLEGELGLEVACVLVHHGKTGENTPSHWVWNAKEDEKEAALERVQPAFVFGDAVLLHYAQPGRFTLQTHNPNLDTVIITRHKPTMCFEGADDVVEKLVNWEPCS